MGLATLNPLYAATSPGKLPTGVHQQHTDSAGPVLQGCILYVGLAAHAFAYRTTLQWHCHHALSRQMESAGGQSALSGLSTEGLSTGQRLASIEAENRTLRSELHQLHERLTVLEGRKATGAFDGAQKTSRYCVYLQQKMQFCSDAARTLCVLA